MIHFAMCESKITHLFFLVLHFSIQFSFTFKHTYIFSMHNADVQSKILDRSREKIAIAFIL